MSLEGKVALITGGGRGIGKALALGLAQEKCKVVVASTTVANNIAVAEIIHKAGGEAMPITMDVAREEDIKLAVEQVMAGFGRIDVLVNNAGLKSGFFPAQSRALKDVPLPMWQRMIDVNVTGVFLCTRYCVPVMLKQGRGSIINTSSGAPSALRPGDGVYAMTKGALNVFTKIMAEEVKAQNIAVNAIIPGFTAVESMDLTRMNPETRRMALRPESCVPLVRFLAEQDPIHITGQIIDVLEWNQSHGYGGREKWAVAASA